MEIKRVIPSGYCKGVVRAVMMAKQARKDHPGEKIYVLGRIVHNRYVAEALKLYDIETLEGPFSKEELLDQVDEGIIIFSAHGISSAIKQKALEKGLKVIDASCEDVIATQELIRKKLGEGFKVLYIGKKNHPEAEAVLSISKDIHPVYNSADIEKIAPEGKVFVTNQTTMSLFEVRDLFAAIAERFPEAEFEKEICSATTRRQQAVIDLKDADLLIVVGDPGSNNSNKLREIGLKNGVKEAFMIEDASQLEEAWLKGKEKIYVTAGASTPPYLTDQVIQTIKKYAETGILEKTTVEIGKIL
ncbi:MAG: 4-hydroxy-3-methylbut-2-enyl diphosphate reductase [Erysipelotrichaceae bacterium]|nr:4-hydroxy-3-methylbut-2-enyl diphosphate reductase [Erysipelotrichaceae bacterium]MBR4122577.1 4-hydroxy-3-methylbut-2-enyl diphosphate reductase [Erysipelotrichaceae bacterium]